MRLIVFFLIVLVALDFATLFYVGPRIGIGATVGLVLLSAFLGLWSIGRGARSRLGRSAEKIEATTLLYEWFCDLTAGFCFLAPGFGSDLVGLLLLLPPLRAVLRPVLGRALARRADSATFTARWTFRGSPRPAPTADEESGEPAVPINGSVEDRPRRRRRRGDEAVRDVDFEIVPESKSSGDDESDPREKT